MPTITVNEKDFCRLLGKRLSEKELEQALEYVKGEIDGKEEENIKIDVKETNRPELWSAEGIARELQTRVGLRKGTAKYKVHDSKYELFIHKSVEKSRPFIASAVVKNVKLDSHAILQIIQLQEKIRGALVTKNESGGGIYDFDKIKMPMHFKGYRDDEIEFVPLDWKIAMRPSEILKEHEKGKEYGHMLEGKEHYPIVIDSNNVVASMPPIINSEATGRVTESTRNIFVEVTGWNWKTVCLNLNVLCMALADRGGTIYSIKTHFPKTKTYPKKPVKTPFFETHKKTILLSYFEEISGLKLSSKELLNLVERSGFEGELKGKKIEINYPAERRDILHPIDIIEDLIISYGYNKIVPEKPELAVRGSELKETLYIDKVRDVCVGLSLQEILTFNLTSIEKQCKNIGVDEELVQIANPVSTNWEVMRKRIFPEHLEFLNKNKRFDYPQKIFEAGTCLELDKNNDLGITQSNHLCIAISGKGTEFNKIKSVLQSVCQNLAIKFSVKESAFPFLKKGKQAEIITQKGKGFLGEVNEKTLKTFGLEQETCILEMEI
jgi:phenylalanyl-tRNA synthetase beta chain